MSRHELFVALGLTVGNTTDHVKAARVRFREGKTGVNCAAAAGIGKAEGFYRPRNGPSRIFPKADIALEFRPSKLDAPPAVDHPDEQSESLAAHAMQR